MFLIYFGFYCGCSRAMKIEKWYPTFLAAQRNAMEKTNQVHVHGQTFLKLRDFVICHQTFPAGIQMCVCTFNAYFFY